MSEYLGIPIGYAESRISRLFDATAACCELSVGELVLSGTIPDYLVELRELRRCQSYRSTVLLSRKTGKSRQTTLSLPLDGEVLVRRPWAASFTGVSKAFIKEVRAGMQLAAVDTRSKAAALLVTPSFFLPVSALLPGDWICFPYFGAGSGDDLEVVSAAPLFAVKTATTDWSCLHERLVARPWHTLIKRKVLMDAQGLWYPVVSSIMAEASLAYYAAVDSVGSVIVNRVIMRTGVKVSQVAKKG